jgi:hypothetical protein
VGGTTGPGSPAVAPPLTPAALQPLEPTGGCEKGRKSEGWLVGKCHEHGISPHVGQVLDLSLSCFVSIAGNGDHQSCGLMTPVI